MNKSEALRLALEALENCASEHGHRCNRCDSEVDEGGKVASALRAALVQQAESQTIDEAVQQPRDMAQAYEAGYKAGAAAERKRIIQLLTEMQRQVGDGHNYYGVAAMRIREME